MKFERIRPNASLTRLVECYWTVENNDPTPIVQKIIPDGFPEVIFHFGDPYSIKLKHEWEKQSRSLFAGQCTGHFFLRNDGVASVLGIKFKPAAVCTLFNISMHNFTDRVVPLDSVACSQLLALESAMKKTDSHAQRISIIEDQLVQMSATLNGDLIMEQVLEKIFSSNGMISVAEICEHAGYSERQLERLFKKYVGLSPKLYARIIRFSYIFQVIQHQHVMNGSELGNASGFYDQSHFIKNFKAFTGEEPSRYFFDEANLANFFLKKR